MEGEPGTHTHALVAYGRLQALHGRALWRDACDDIHWVGTPEARTVARPAG